MCFLLLHFDDMGAHTMCALCTYKCAANCLCNYSNPSNNNYGYYPFFYLWHIHRTSRESNKCADHIVLGACAKCTSTNKQMHAEPIDAFNANFVAYNCIFDDRFPIVSDCRHSVCRVCRFLCAYLLLKLRSISNSVCK